MSLREVNEINSEEKAVEFLGYLDGFKWKDRKCAKCGRITEKKNERSSAEGVEKVPVLRCRHRTWDRRIRAYAI